MRKTLKILLVEDDADDQLYFIDALKMVNPSAICEIANNGNEAIQQMEVPPPPDLIFLDLNMPIMNGFEYLGSIKNETRFREIPVVIFTTSKNSQDIDRTKELGAKLFFTKPANFKEFCNKLDQIMTLDFNAMEFIV